jgi:deoxyribodipyrimidine photo-lyase
LGNVPIKFFEQLSLINPQHLPFEINNLPDTFTEFRKQVEKDSKIRSPFNIPSHLPSFPEIDAEGEIGVLEEFINSTDSKDPRSSFKFQGGESEGLKRLHDYIWKRRLISRYKNTRNGMIGESYSSKFSPWLAVGSLSPRQIYNEIKRFERSEVKNISTYWLIFELLWRDYFRFVAMKYGNKIFKKGGIKNLHRNYSNDHSLFSRWLNGETGDDFVDANMIELNTTGYMSNRGRQNAASYLVHDLGIDWRWGAAYFESKLIDYDVCSNWGNWMYIAGVGNDPRPNRKFNTHFQAKKYDPNRKYRELWLSNQLIYDF